ncbi:hypothetical protein L227DRAFT_579397 [Lentinus tigrinus ALCF2SS1-6]|uniref:PB1 domain-containing protein n=1 Tax=Lentinus tigrinus ALCF2SS1-6 TaxID=1328759 RepID=A0A5C2RXX6_9APHY|nr:hypothetical protein L227DRAFT_579397 [Lentinus tigrinus ALCF2SS1-6]
MSPIQFKFSRPPDGLVRRVTFPEKPSWDVLAAKIEALYNIPVPSIGVSYVDNDGDEVTLSSEEELQDFYQSAAQQRNDGELILVKFAVRDLDALHNDKPLPETPRTTSAMNYRNTFGRSAPVLFEMEVDDGWQPIPSGIGGILDSARPHAFVEVLDSDADVSQFSRQDHDDSSTTTGTTNTLPEIIPTPTAEKGKGRARSEDLRSCTPDTVSSTQSVIAEEFSPKHPIHVLSVHNRRGSRSRTSTALTTRTPTPKARTPNPADQPSGEDDPPLPDLDNMSSQVNIANDVAELFANLSTILASHPELSEGIRNIVRNVSDGTYWQSHREQVARAAEEVRRSAILGADELRQVASDSRRAAEDAAGRRVADAIGNVIRVIADITGAQAGDPHAQPAAGEPTTSTPLRERPFGRGLGHHLWGDSWDGFGGRGRGAGPRGRGGSFRGRGGFGRGVPPSWGSFGSHWDESGPFSGGVPFSGPPPPPPFGTFQAPPGPPSPPQGPPPVPPPPPGPFGHHHHGHFPPDDSPAGPPPMFGGRFGHHRGGSFPMGDSPVGPPPLHRGHFGGPPPFGPPHMRGGPRDWDFEDDPFTMGRGWHAHHHRDWADTVPGLPPPPPRPNASADDAEVTMYGVTSTESPDAAKRSLQAAKEAYIAEKEKYRRLRQERKKHRMNVSTDSEMKDSPITPRDAQEPAVRPVGEPSTAPPQDNPVQEAPRVQEEPQIVSNARGPFPQLELYSVPRRSHTVHGTGHGHRRDASWGTFGSGMSTHAGRAAAAESIVRRLSDMGFTPTKYPVLTSKVESRVPRHGEVSKEREDSIVTEVVEELLQTSPAPEPQASGSGTRAN